MKQALIERIYDATHTLASKSINQGFSRLEDPIPAAFQQQGLYLFLDRAIPRTNAKSSKIIRVGITGINNSPRLSQHRSGNMESSIFRKHVGRSLSAKNNRIATELEVSQYLHPLEYVFLPVSNESLLRQLEKNLIALLSNHGIVNPADQPPANWLGFQRNVNTNEAIASSHLWNVHYVKGFDIRKINEFEESVYRLECLSNDLI
jgi:hypothetical protein